VDVDGFVASLHLTGRSEATVRAYRQDLLRWERCGGDPAVYLGGAAASRARRFSALRAYWTWAEEQGMAPGAFPLAGVPHPRVHLPPPRALAEADAEQLTAAIRGLPLPWRALFTLLLDTGLRVGEVTRLRVRDLEWAAGSEGLRVHGKGGRWREVPLLPGMASRTLLRRVATGKPGEAYLFPGRGEGRLTVRAVEKRFAAVCQVAGVSGVRVHDLWHTCATRLVNRGVDILAVQRLLGHASVQTTQRYGRLGDREYRRALEGGGATG
jgi:integrase